MGRPPDRYHPDGAQSRPEPARLLPRHDRLLERAFRAERYQEIVDVVQAEDFWLPQALGGQSAWRHGKEGRGGPARRILARLMDQRRRCRRALRGDAPVVRPRRRGVHPLRRSYKPRRDVPGAVPGHRQDVPAQTAGGDPHGSGKRDAGRGRKVVRHGQTARPLRRRDQARSDVALRSEDTRARCPRLRGEGARVRHGGGLRRARLVYRRDTATRSPAPTCGWLITRHWRPPRRSAALRKPSS